MASVWLASVWMPPLFVCTLLLSKSDHAPRWQLEQSRSELSVLMATTACSGGGATLRCGAGWGVGVGLSFGMGLGMGADGLPSSLLFGDLLSLGRALDDWNEVRTYVPFTPMPSTCAVHTHAVHLCRSHPCRSHVRAIHNCAVHRPVVQTTSLYCPT